MLPTVLQTVVLAAALLARPAVTQDNGGGGAKPFSLPHHDDDPQERVNSISIKREGILYGPGPDQNQTAYPAGKLGDILWKTETANLSAEQDRHFGLVMKDAKIVLQTLSKTGGIRSLADYAKLFDGQWKNSMGNVIDPSFFTNYTSDVFFAMQRLTLNPFALRRLKPQERLPFAVDDDVARNVTGGHTAGQLLLQGRLFYADYTALARLPVQQGRASAACEAYFYISPQDGRWLPLAIKPGSDLPVYTPADAPLDWLFAKIALGQCDAWDTPWRHFASTHLTVELPYLAAQRCMADDHPVLAVYQKFMLNGFAFRQFLQERLYAPGQYTDQLFSFDGRAARKYTMDLYENGENRFRANYFPTHLERHGLLNSPLGPPISYFPFAEDASAIHTAWKAFMTAFVHSYYPHDLAPRHDDELTCWFKEVRSAGAVDFPPPDELSTGTLVDVLTHVAYLNSVQHQAMNNNDQFLSALLPASPVAFYKSLPTGKGLTEGDLLAMLPNATQAVGQLSISAAFSRPEFVDSARALINVFKDEELYARLNEETRAAAGVFEGAMGVLSAEIEGRRFDGEGLYRGVPFIWRALDPRVALFAMTI